MTPHCRSTNAPSRYVRQLLGAQHPDTAASLNNLAVLHANRAAWTAALPLMERALAIRSQVLGAQHPLTAASVQNLAAMRRDSGYKPRRRAAIVAIGSGIASPSPLKGGTGGVTEATGDGTDRTSGGTDKMYRSPCALYRSKWCLYRSLCALYCTKWCLYRFLRGLYRSKCALYDTKWCLYCLLWCLYDTVCGLCGRACALHRLHGTLQPIVRVPSLWRGEGQVGILYRCRNTAVL